MSRYEIRMGELTGLGYKINQSQETAKAEEAERTTDALNRIADALEKQNAGKIPTIAGGYIKTGQCSYLGCNNRVDQMDMVEIAPGKFDMRPVCSEHVGTLIGNVLIEGKIS